jgi:prepilin-type N-terminal cleavage/methylation domain-containing protein
VSGRRFGSGFTLIELLVVMAVLAVLAALLLPALQGAGERAKMTACVAQLRQMGVLISVYAADHSAEVPQGLGAIGTCDHKPCVCEDRGGMWLKWKNPCGLGLLYTGGYVASGRAFYCPSQYPEQYGGYTNGKGWNPSGGEEWTTTYSVASYWYRYAAGSTKLDVIRTIPDCTRDNGQIHRWRAKITHLSQRCPAAVWDGYHDDSTCCGSLNRGYHRLGYNVLFYSGEVFILPAAKWSGFPFNVFYDSDDNSEPGFRGFDDLADGLLK